MTTLRMQARAIVCLGIASLGLTLAACGGDRGARTASCECGAGSFCCLDRCLPLGSVCGDADAGASDGPVIAPDGEGPAMCDRECNDGYECRAWSDSTGASGTWCFAPGEIACDLSDAGATTRCDGTTSLISCSPTPWGTDGPRGLGARIDCVAHYGPTSTCVPSDEGATCTRETCDPATFPPRCEGAMVTVRCEGGSVLYQSCGASTHCLDNALTQMSGGVFCLPDSAEASSRPGTVEEELLECVGDAVRVQQYGYEWVHSCGLGNVCTSTDRVRCEGPGTERCDPATFTPSCGADGQSERICSGDSVYVNACGWGAAPHLAAACDPLDGHCIPSEPCGGTIAPYCIRDGRFRMVCYPSIGLALAEACPGGCHVDTTGAAICE